MRTMEIRRNRRPWGGRRASLRKPDHRDYRHLTARGCRIYYQRVFGGQRLRFSMETSDWEEARQRRDIFEGAVERFDLSGR